MICPSGQLKVTLASSAAVPHTFFPPVLVAPPVLRLAVVGVPPSLLAPPRAEVPPAWLAPPLALVRSLVPPEVDVRLRLPRTLPPLLEEPPASAPTPPAATNSPP